MCLAIGVPNRAVIVGNDVAAVLDRAREARVAETSGTVW